jgi:hypothetical protein
LIHAAFALDDASEVAHTLGMTWDAAARAALRDKRDQLGWSNNDIEQRVIAQFGSRRPTGLSGSSVDRMLRGDGKMSVQQMEVLTTVLDVNLLDVLGRITPGQAAEYRCILPLESCRVNVQVRGGLHETMLTLSQRLHAA